MLLLLHVSAALASLMLSGITLFKPSRRRLTSSYALVGLAIASGIYLIFSRHSHILSACATGLLYLTIVFSELILAHKRFAQPNSSN